MVSGCLLLTACGGGPVEIDAPELGGADRDACAGFVEALPATLVEEEPREVEPDDVLAAAYGDPAIVALCGVDLPVGFNRASACEEVEGVGWYAPPEQYDDQTADVTIFAVSHRPVVELRLPSDYRPNGLAAALAALAGPVTENLEEVHDCV